ncbi:MAG: glycosyltransferase [Kofleriaceae bacterium]|nr:glycosyltransferase [Kofleriaceae bacterium]
MGSPDESLLCLSHLRWKFVYQRPQHLLGRCARERTVVFFEEPIFEPIDDGRLALMDTPEGVVVATPHIPVTMEREAAEDVQRGMVDRVLAALPPHPVLWYYTPMPVAFTDHVRARAVVYDCMDELSLFRGAPPELAERERLLFDCADVVFTGGHSLYEHKIRTSGHENIHAFPSSVDVDHFRCARYELDEPRDQADIPHPRIGVCGVIDERTNLDLHAQLAEARPDLQIVMIGPLAKISSDVLPRAPNIHWLGPRRYEQLPAYLAGWDVAMLPFAHNEATRFISPTKTPEYLAAGKPVVSTSIRDVVTPYGRDGLAWIADSALEFEHAIDAALASDPATRISQADTFLAGLSWDRTWREMWSHVERAIAARERRPSSMTQPWAGAAERGEVY